MPMAPPAPRTSRDLFGLVTAFGPVVEDGELVLATAPPPELASAIVTAFLDTPFEGGRHQRRIDKLTQLDFARD